MSQYIGKTGQPCPICTTGVIKSSWSQTCGQLACVSAYRKGNTGPQPTLVPDTVEKRTDSTWDVSMAKTRIHTLEQLVAHCKVDLEIWEVAEFTVNKWEMASVPRSVRPDGNSKWARPSTKPVVEELFQVKARLKKRVHIVAARQELEDLKASFKSKKLFAMPKLAKGARNGTMLEVMMPDSHFGKLAWGKETGWGNTDLNITERDYWTAFHAALARARHASEYEKILLVIGNDLLNSDNLEGLTTRGTAVTNDGRYPRTFKRVREIMVETINILQEIAPVEVVMVAGNHDTQSVWCLGDSLEMRFHAAGHVTINNEPTQRKYVEFGQVLLGFTHGDKGKRLDYPLLMATEAKEMYGRTSFHEWHTGHNHTTKVEEQHGIRVRTFAAISGHDSWHAGMGFVGNKRATEFMIWDKKEGLVGTVIYTLPDRGAQSEIKAA